jgi:hypothetical protein
MIQIVSRNENFVKSYLASILYTYDLKMDDANSIEDVEYASNIMYESVKELYNMLK